MTDKSMNTPAAPHDMAVLADTPWPIDGTRRCLLRSFAAASLSGLGLLSAAAPAQQRAPREMRIHEVGALGLEIWVENQPPWESQLMRGPDLPTFVVQSPANYYPPAVMTYVGTPQAQANAQSFESMASVAIRRAARNYAVTAAARLGIHPEPARYGVLSGFEATFDGVAGGEAVQVKVFLGRTPGRFPVAMQIYSLPGKLAHLTEPVRRAWTQVKYLK